MKQEGFGDAKENVYRFSGGGSGGWGGLSYLYVWNLLVSLLFAGSGQLWEQQGWEGAVGRLQT